MEGCVGRPSFGVLAVFLAVFACGGGGNAGTDAPRHFAAAEVWFGTIRLTWDPASADGYELDVRLGSSPWQPIPGPISGDAVGGDFTLSPTVPEMTPLSFRIRAVRGGVRSSYARADVLHGVHPPESLVATVGALTQFGLPLYVGPVSLAWTNESTVATDLLVERAVEGPSREWTPLPTAFDMTSLVDDAPLEGVQYVYRVRYGVAGTWSLPSSTNPAPIELKLPSTLAVHPIPGGYRVSWVNRSPTVTQLVLGRWESAPSSVTGDPFVPPSGETLITLPASVDHYDDLAPAFFPTTRYALRVVRGTYTVTVPGPMLSLPPILLTGPMAFTGTAAELPGGEWVARDGAGRFHFLSGTTSLTVSRQMPTGWDTYSIAGWATGLGVAADAEGHTHALFSRGAVGPAGHAWYDGTEWQQEDLPADSCVSEQFGVSADGHVHLLCTTLSATYAYRVGSTPGWSAVESPAVTTVPNFLAYQTQFAVARDGTADVLALGTGGPGMPPSTFAVLLERAPGGGWSERSATLVASPADPIWVLPAAAANAAFLYATRAPDGVSQQLFFVQEGPLGFGAAELVVQRSAPMYGTNLTAALSDDGARVHVLLASDLNQEPLRLYRRTGTGWEGMDFAPSGPFPTGYGTDGNAWVLAGFDIFNEATLSDHALWLEN